MIIETKRLILRDFQDDDIEDLGELAVDPLLQLARGTDIQLLLDEQVHYNVQHNIQPSLGERSIYSRISYLHVIRLKTLPRLIGWLQLETFGSQQAEMRYNLDHHFWNQGYGIEAAHALLRFGFKELELRRIITQCWATNTDKKLLNEELGMRLETHLHKALLLNGDWQDILFYAILDEMWKKQVTSYE